jgi:hypothetical protein
LVEDCRRETIAPLLRDALNRGRGQVHHGHLQNFDKPYSIYLSTDENFAGSWLAIGHAGDNAGFPLSVDRFVRWRRKQG